MLSGKNFNSCNLQIINIMQRKYKKEACFYISGNNNHFVH